MENTSTSYMSPLAVISALLIIVPLFYFFVVKAGMYYDLAFLFMCIFLFLTIVIMYGMDYLYDRYPFYVLSFTVIIAYSLYYYFLVWNPYPIHTELRYQENTTLNGPIASYHENHYLLSGSIEHPKRKRILNKTLTVFFDERGNNIKDSLLYRNGFLERSDIRGEYYTYNQFNQLIKKRDLFNDTHIHTYTYNDTGRLVGIVEEESFVSKNRPTDRRIETIYTYDEVENTVLIEEKEFTTRHYPSTDTSYTDLYQITRQHYVNEKGQILYEGYVENDSFEYNIKYDYNEKGQLISKLEILSYHYQTTYTYDSEGHLKEERRITLEEDSTDTNNDIKIILYDTLGYRTYEHMIYHYEDEEEPYFPLLRRQLFYENLYDDFNNLIQQKVFIQENDRSKRPYYVVEIDLTYYKE